MTTAQVMEPERNTDIVDLVVVARVISGWPPGCELSEAEVRLAAWTLFDRGFSCKRIRKDTVLNEYQVAQVSRVRTLALTPPNPDRPRTGRRGGLTHERAKQLAPTVDERAVLRGVGLKP